ncbi:MAG: hypothetical protein JXA57_17895 [Armatimonadetes bacterium]|nr:hypothetical protein [Armatimonadota bacterium]
MASARLPITLQILAVGAVSLAWFLAGIPKEQSYLVAGVGLVLSFTGVVLALHRRLSKKMTASVLAGFILVVAALLLPIWQPHSGGILGYPDHCHFLWDIGHLH